MPTYDRNYPVPDSAVITDQYSNIGVIFEDTVLVKLGVGHAPSGENGIGSIDAHGNLDYRTRRMRFVSPQDGTTDAVTDYFSISTDNWGWSRNTITVSGFALDGTLLGQVSYTEGAGGVTLKLENMGLFHVVVIDAMCGATCFPGGIALDLVEYGELTPVPAPTPPVADADGPYTIYVGDTLTLDANGSIDDDNDIVSYRWDLDDNGSFETDANDQAVFDVNYSCLQSLGLLVENTYNIHLLVTDSEGQSDTNDTTLTILPKPALKVAVDIKPGSCPNPLSVKSSGVLPVAILGSEDLDVNRIDAASIELAGVGVIRHSREDVAGPVSDANDCNCTEDGPDGFMDLTLKLKTQDMVEAIGEVDDGDVLPLELTGVLFGERPIEGNDCVLIRGKFKPFNKADTNRDGVVDLRDFAIFADNWLQATVVDE